VLELLEQRFATREDGSATGQEIKCYQRASTSLRRLLGSLGLMPNDIVERLRPGPVCKASYASDPNAIFSSARFHDLARVGAPKKVLLCRSVLARSRSRRFASSRRGPCRILSTHGRTAFAPPARTHVRLALALLLVRITAGFLAF
jgi:hypothetical protein